MTSNFRSVQKIDSDNLADTLDKISGGGLSNGVVSDAILSESQVGENVLRHVDSRQRQMQREETLTDPVDDCQETKELKKVTSILKGGGFDLSNRATATLICEGSGIQYNKRCLRLMENDEAKIGRCIKTGGALPDEVKPILHSFQITLV